MTVEDRAIEYVDSMGSYERVGPSVDIGRNACALAGSDSPGVAKAPCAGRVIEFDIGFDRGVDEQELLGLHCHLGSVA